MNSYASPCPRAEQVWEYCNAVASDGPFKRLTKADAVKLVQWLDINYAGWDNAGDGTPLNAWHAADCCRVAWECIPYVLPEKVKARSRLDRAGALEELADLREFHHAINNDSYKKMNLGILNAGRAEVRVNYPRKAGGWRGVLYGAAVGAVICACVVLWIVMKAPEEKAATTHAPVVAKPQRKLTRDEQRAEDLIRLRMENNGELKFRDFYTQRYPAAMHVQVHFDVLEWGGQTSQHAWTIVFSLDGKELNTTKNGTLSKAPTRDEREESLHRKIQRELGPQRQAEIRLFHETERGNDVFVEAEYEVKKPNGTSVKKTWRANFEKATNALVGYDSPYQ